MEAFFGYIFVLILSLTLLLNIVSLPANWLMLCLVGLWYWIHPAPTGMDLMFFVTLIGLAILGEVIEFVLQAWGSKKYGSSTGGMWAGLAGAFIGALLGMPFFLGLGALFGALIGAWVGCYLLERLRGRSAEAAYEAAKGALVGRLLGLIIKLAVGFVMVLLIYGALQTDNTKFLQDTLLPVPL